MKTSSIFLLSSFAVGVAIISIVVVMYPPNNTPIHVDTVFPSKSNSQKYGQTVKIIVEVKERLENSNILPLVITQVISVEPSVSEIKTVGFLPTVYGNRIENGTRYDRDVTILEKQFLFNITDETGKPAIDESRLSGGGFFVRDGLGGTMARCGDEYKLVYIPYGNMVTLPIHNGTSKIFASASTVGITPEENGEYYLRFASFYDNEIKLPQNSQVIFAKTSDCVIDKANNVNGKLDEVVFRLNS
jgi:hypothetical protein